MNLLRKFNEKGERIKEEMLAYTSLITKAFSANCNSIYTKNTIDH